MKGNVSAQVVMQHGVVHVVDMPAMHVETLAGTLGGILNLWVGITFVTLVEVSVQVT